MGLWDKDEQKTELIASNWYRTLISSKLLLREILSRLSITWICHHQSEYTEITNPMYIHIL